MKKSWSYFIFSILLAICIFLIVSLTMSNIHDQSIVDEWKSWLPEDKQEEVVESVDNSEIETNIEVEMVA